MPLAYIHLAPQLLSNKKMDTQRSSYRYDSFTGKEQVEEFERLYRQASSLIETERQLWPGLNIAKGQRVLDVGCGSGVITREIAKQVYPAPVVGLDMSQALLEKGRQMGADSSQNITFQAGSAYDLPFADNSFDIVYARLLFQHLSEPLTALNNIWRVLKPGGLLCILDVDRDWSSLYPEPASSVALDQAIIKTQIAEGGDPWVGRKRSYYLKSCQFSQVKTTISLIDSDRLGTERFFGMLSLGEAGKAVHDDIKQVQGSAKADVKALVNDPYVWAGFGLFVVTGRKPVLSK